MALISPIDRPVVFQTYDQLVDFLYGLKRRYIKLGLENIQFLMESTDHPEREFPSIHVAGTNGKGSTCAILESVLRQARYKTGLYTSPHLVDFRERIQISGKRIPEKIAWLYAEKLLPLIDVSQCSFFETLTTMAFTYFRDQEIDVGVIEVGMGGRLDATNVVYSDVVVITEIDFDHEKHLGKTIPEIAREKAGIVKPGVPTLIGARNEEAIRTIQEICLRRNSRAIWAWEGVELQIHQLGPDFSRFSVKTPYRKYKNLKLALVGEHQIHNAVVALRALEELDPTRFRITERAVQRGFRQVFWPGRLQIIRQHPAFVLDVAHNPQSVEKAVEQAARIFPHKRLFCIFGVLEDKNYPEMIRRIAPYVDAFWTVTPESERALHADQLAVEITAVGRPVKVAESIPAAVEEVLGIAGEEDLVLAVGSHFLLGSVYRHFKLDPFEVH